MRILTARTLFAVALTLTAGLWAQTAEASCHCPNGVWVAGDFCVRPPNTPGGTPIMLGRAVCNGGLSGGSVQTPRYRYLSDDPEFQRRNRLVQCTPEGSGQVCQHWYDEGRRQLETVMPFNQKREVHGTVRTYWENGKPKYVLHYRNGKVVGEAQEFDRNGKLSKRVYYNDNGRVVRAQEIANGKPHGAEAFFSYDPSGELHLDRVVQWENGKVISDKSASASGGAAGGSSAKGMWLWKAIALNGNNTVHNITNTYIAGASSRDAAVAQALEQCRKGEKAGNDCQSWVSFSNICLAFQAGNRGGKEFYYAGGAKTIHEAEAAAVDRCQSRAQDCRQAQAAVCALPCDPKSSSCTIGRPVVKGVKL